MPLAPDHDLTALGAAEAARRIRAGTLSPLDLVEACLARIRALDGRLEAWVHVEESGARAAARAAARDAGHGRARGLLHGVPVGIKDIIDVAGMPTRAGAPAFAHTTPARDAAAVARLREAGAIVLGKTHTTQFALRDPAPTRNPWNPGHTPGGSSAGSAAAVAARMTPLALGTQTVGSVLRPAAYCGVVGFKGTHGLVPAAGVVPLAWSYDHVGVFARRVEDVALALEALVAESVRIAVPSEPPRLALAPELTGAAGAEVASRLEATAQAFARAGARIVEVKLPPSYGGLHERGQVILEAEAATYHAPAFARHEAEYAPGIRGAVTRGLAHRATAYVEAEGARRRFREAVMPLLAEHDALLAPVAHTTAPPGLASTGDPFFCAPWSWTGVPAISLPSGLGEGGLPHAIQLVQAAGADGHLLSVAAWCERELAFTAVPAL